MDEKKMKKRLSRVVTFSVCIICCLCLAGVAVAQVFIHTFSQVTKERMYEEVKKYNERIQRQIDNNFQALKTFSSFIETSEIYKEDVFERTLEQADLQNDFLMFGYFDRKGNAIFSKDKNKKYTSLSQLQREIQEVVEENCKGNAVVSDAFLGQLSSKKVFVYGVPVYREGDVIGALVASDSVDAFSEEIESKRAFHGNGVVHLIDADGNYIIRGEEMIVKEEKNTILEPPYMSETDAVYAKNALKNNKEYEFNFVYDKNEYSGLIEPLGINRWYLICINSLKNVNQNTYVIAYVASAFFVAFTAIFFFILLYGYNQMKTGNQKLREMAYYDELTGIYNFRYFEGFCMEQSRKEKMYAILTLNIRKFKFINEMVGNEQADQLLCFIAKVLANSILEDECVCRESADYFYLYLHYKNREILEKRIQNIMERIVKNKEIEKCGYRLTLRCGVAVSQLELGAKEVMTNAMFAMEHSKSDVQQKYYIFDTALHEREQLDNYIFNHAPQALENQEFKLYLQPKIDLKNDTISGAEALVRWIKSDGTMIRPGIFIPLFEENGFCVEMDMYMLEYVCKELRKWMDEGKKPINISVNQSRRTFYKEDYISKLCEILGKYRIPTSLITLEILEGIILQDAETLDYRLGKLKELGFRISMDDFGTGYSSLNILGKLQIDELKLDRGFLEEIMEDKNKNIKLIVEEIVNLAKKLSISTVIEGVETKEEDSFAKKIGCEQAQGYFYSKPVEVNEFTRKFIV